jgi:penicillin-binding protein 1A
MASRKIIRRILWGVWGVVLLGTLSIFLLFFLISSGAFGKLPTFEELENPQSALATQVISADGVVLGVYYSENRSNILFEDLPENLVHALVATEDERFYDHSGIDFIAIGRVVRGLITGEYAGGGSTITQQLAKNLFPREDLNTFQLVIRKFKEWVIAVKLERSYTKEEIIAMYLNTVEFSDNAFGIQSASATYFNKEPRELLPEESAVLVGMLKAPYKYNPRVNPQNSKERRNVVLSKMAEYGYLDATARDTLLEKDILLQFKAASHNEGPAPYFREILRLELKKWSDNNPKPNGSKWDIYRDGLKIYTTIDSRMQLYAENAVNSHLSEMQKTFNEHWEGRDPWSGYENEFERAYTNSPRYSNLVNLGVPRDSIDTLLSQPIPMKVFTWQGELDTVMSVIDSLKFARKFLQTGFMVMDPKTGYIKAWVGGINYKYYQYDHVNINTKRQVGSTFKPFVYTVAIKEKGLSP